MPDHIHKGFYKNGDVVKSLAAITYETIMGSAPDEDGVYSDAAVFLMGSCQLFSYALMNAFGYIPYEIRDNSNNIHCFCQSKYQGKRVYIDVRGITSDFDEFLRTSCISHSGEITIIRQGVSKADLFPAEWDEDFGLPFARRIVKEYSAHYTVED